MKLLLYCTKAKPVLKVCTGDCSDYPYEGNGKIVAECDFEVEEIFTQERGDYNYDCFSSPDYLTETLSADELADKSCLTYEELDDYLDTENGYAIHIKNLHIFDEPKELNEVYSIKDIGGGLLVTEPLKKAPQNMMRVSLYKWNYAWANFDDIRILISIRPEWMCLILNRIKDVEVRRVVLKEMLK